MFKTWGPCLSCQSTLCGSGGRGAGREESGVGQVVGGPVERSTGWPAVSGDSGRSRHS